MFERDLTIAKSSQDITVRDAADEMLTFLDKGKRLASSHYVAFEGP